jgi:putative ABC transport system permease protein
VRTNGLARAAVRCRPAAFAGTFVALMMAALIVSACGILLETGLRVAVPPQRYAAAPVVVAADQQAHLVTGSGEGRTDSPQPLPDRARVDARLAERIAAAPGVAAAVPDVTFPVRLAGGGELTAQGWGAHAFTGAAAVAGAAPDGDGEVVIDRATARAAGLGPGDRVTLVLPAGEREFRVSGVARTSRATDPAAWFADAAAPALAGHPGRADAIAVLPGDGTGAEALAGAVREAVGDRAKVHTGDGRGAVEDLDVPQAKELLAALGGSFGGIATTVAVFTAAGTVALGVAQRRQEFALLRAIGATPRQIRRTVATEALVVAPLAGAVGCLPGIALAAWWFGQLRDRGAVPAGVELHVSWIPLVSAVSAGLLTALLAGWAAARRPARIKPGQALTEAAVERPRPGVVRTVLGVGALAGGGVLAAVAASAAGEDAANAALGVVMLLMLAVALLGPLIARLCAGLFGLPLRAAGGADAELAAANSRANARRLASAITPIALATAIASTLVFLHTSEDHAADGQLRAALVADHVVTHRAGLPADAAARAARAPGVDAAVGMLSASMLVPVSSAGDRWLQAATAQGVSGDVVDLNRVLDLDVRDGSLDGVDSADAVAIDVLLARSADVGVGDRLELWLPDGTRARPLVVATYARGLGLAQVTMGRAALSGHVSDAYDSSVLVSGGDAAALHGLGELGGPGTQVTGAEGYARQEDTERGLNRWANYTMAGVLGGFAAIAAVNTLVMTVLDRRRELGLLRLVGATRRQVLGMVRWEALLVAFAGLALGTAITAVTLYPMAHGLTGEAPYVPPLVYAAFAATAVTLSLLSTSLPARGALR